jgi:hypothetical protein
MGWGGGGGDVRETKAIHNKYSQKKIYSVYLLAMSNVLFWMGLNNITLDEPLR